MPDVLFFDHLSDDDKPLVVPPIQEAIDYVQGANMMPSEIYNALGVAVATLTSVRDYVLESENRHREIYDRMRDLEKLIRSLVIIYRNKGEFLTLNHVQELERAAKLLPWDNVIELIANELRDRYEKGEKEDKNE